MLRRIEGYKLVNEAAFGAIDSWKRMRHPNIVSLREAFTTKGFGDNCESPDVYQTQRRG
jgi:PAB-dependent poly(A)-specific ribonuclease subunit 3